MASHNELGKEGEEMAVKWLEENGFDILHQNWRHSHYEIDIIATKLHPDRKTTQKEFLHFIEVKARNYTQFGYPEDSVGKKKFKSLKKAADEFLFQNPGHKWIQYDILSITVYKDKKPEYFFIEDVFI